MNKQIQRALALGKIHDPELRHWARVAATIEATMMASASTALPNGLDTFVPGEWDASLALAMNELEAWIGGYEGPEALTGVFAQSIPDVAATSSVTATAGTVIQAGIWLPAGKTVTNLSVISAVTAASTPTNSWMGLASAIEAPKCLAISADALTGAIAADTIQTYAMATPYVVPTAGLYIAFFCCAATTGPTLAAGVTQGTHGRGAVEPWVFGVGDTGKTTPYAVAASVGEATAASASLLVYAN